MNAVYPLISAATMIWSMTDNRDHIVPRDDYRSYATRSDEALIKAVTKADNLAYTELVNRHLKRILAFAHRHLGNEAEAEEVAQETMLRLWTKADRFQPGRARLDTWLHRIAYNLSIDLIRRRRQVALDDIAEPADERQDQFADYYAGQISAQVKQALDGLPERQRAALVLSHYQGLSNEETGDILEVSVEAVESLLARGRRTLKQRLAGTLAEIKSEGSGI